MKDPFDRERLARAELIAKAAQEWLDSRKSDTKSVRGWQTAKPSSLCPILRDLPVANESGLEERK